MKIYIMIENQGIHKSHAANQKDEENSSGSGDDNEKTWKRKEIVNKPNMLN